MSGGLVEGVRWGCVRKGNSMRSTAGMQGVNARLRHRAGIK